MTLETIFTMNMSSIKYGAGATREVGYDMQQLGARRVMVVADPALAHQEPVSITLASLREAGLDDLEQSVQKDLWHLQRDGGQLCRDLERAAFRATKQVLALEAKLRKAWNAELFLNQYIPAVMTEAKR